MIIVWLALLTKVVSSDHVTPYLAHIDELSNVAKLDDADNRGPSWYDYDSSKSSHTEESSTASDEELSSESSSSSSSKDSESASSLETSERKIATRVYRVCTPCPSDMMKKFRNHGIGWICGGYQRARRSFKSECMMRYRNCEDGTMFVKMYDTRCKKDPYHGRHWFYIYRT